MGKFLIEKNSKIICFLTEDRYKALRHAILIIDFLILYASARVLFHLNETEQYSGNYGFYHALSPFVVFIFVIYINIYAITPVFFKGKYVLYIFMVMGLCLSALTFLHYVIDPIFEPYYIGPQQQRLNSFVQLLSASIFTMPIVLASSTGRLMQKWIKDSEEITELKTITTNMELEALRNQINPHFLFNMLNNVNMLTRSNPEKASAVIVKLSEFLRYQLYENNAEKTSLVGEEEFLSNFLNLEKIRRDNFNFTLTCTTPGQHISNIQIPPNLFTTFVENAIKHSVDLSGNEAWVHITITTQNGLLEFSCVNSMNPDEQYRDTHEGGLGLANIKRRLEILYGDAYSLNCQNNTITYNVTLTIPYDLYYS
ncbi:sensor histidine kinase [Flavobacterium sp. RHBU_3]|uniref:sensor histidine kinase n=1 Tax=Flavobacterium sp. RHBU_3 TaxID=3391184 RepID=UPI003984AC63